MTSVSAVSSKPDCRFSWGI